MSKKIIAIMVIGWLLTTSLVATAKFVSINNIKIDKEESIDMQKEIIYTEEGNIIEKESNVESCGRGCDLSINNFRAAFGYCWYAYECNGVFTILDISRDVMCPDKDYRIAFFADDETEPFAMLKVSITTSGISYFFPREEELESVRVNIDYYNDIIETNENNNEQESQITPVITVEGYVEVEFLGNVEPVSDLRIGSIQRTVLTNHKGYYNLGVIAKSPNTNPHTYTIYSRESYLGKNILKVTNPVLPGDTTPLNFLISKVPTDPSKPSGPSSVKINTDNTFSTTSSDKDGDKLFYQWLWDGNKESEWMGPYEAGEKCEITITWSQTKVTELKVYVRDEGGTINKNPGRKTIVVSKSRALNTYLEIFLNNYPILQKILEMIQ